MIPLQRLDIEKHRTRRIGDIRNVAGATGQLPYQPRIYRAETELASLRPISDAFHMVKDPFDFCSREISVDHQACLLMDATRPALGFQLLTVVGCTPILPNNRIIDRETGLTIPNDGCLSLIGDTNRR